MKTTIQYSVVIITILLIGCNARNNNSKSSETKQIYTCPMHPQIVQDKPGTCPVCGMDLVPITAGGDKSEVTLSESQIELANITVQRVSVQEIGNSILLNGRLRADETQTEVVSTRVPGRIDKLFIKETGVSINQGQLIYEIYSEQLLTYQNEYLLALAQSQSVDNRRYFSYLEAARKKLWLYGMTEYQIEELSKSKTTNPRIQFVAPASGIVTEIPVAEGQYVAEGAAIYRLEKLSKLWVEAEMYPREASLIKLGDRITIYVDGFENQPIESKVIFLSPEYRQSSQIFVLRAYLANNEHRFAPGMQAEIVFEHSKKKALTLPADAVIREESGNHVYMKTGVGKYRPQMIATGLENFNKVEITSGVEEGDSIVVTGAYLLYSEIVLKKGVNPMAGHNHDHVAEQTSDVTQVTRAETPMVVDHTFTQQIKELLRPYFKIEDALVASDAKSASAQTSAFNTALKNVDMGLVKGDAHVKWMDQLRSLETAINLISSAADIEVQRAAFSQLTNTLYSSVKIFGVEGLDAYYQFCPMAFDNKGAFWISDEKVISNPYFGEQMLRCGETKETLK